MSGPKVPERKLRSQFPRSDVPPTQSSKFWAKEKDRYLRQLLLSDIEEESGRETIVYFSQLNQGISHTDADDISEIIDGLASKSADLIIQTPGGMVDAVEKFVTVLKARLTDYRVIVPSWAKSGGTVIAMSSQKILLGVNSELGPIDPQMFVPEIGPVPCEFVANDESQPHIIRQIAASSVERMRELAKRILRDGMLADANEDKIETILDKISSSKTYKSHGAVIDFSEAESLGLDVQFMDPHSSYWKKIWLSYCCYDYDCKTKGIAKITEGARFSIARVIED